MRVLLYAHDFAPSVGGAETYTLLLARGLAARAEVTVACQTAAGGFDDAALPFRVVRRPGTRTLWRLVREADVVHLAGPVLWPLLITWLQGRPVVVEHHGYQAACPNGLLLLWPEAEACPGHFLARRYGRCLRCNASERGWVRSLRMLAATFARRWLSARMAANVGVSEHAARRVALPRSQVIYHGVEDPLGGGSPADPPASPSIGFAYVGRLVAEKGLPLLLQASRRLRDRGIPFSLTIVGDGPERPRLEALAQELDLEDSVTFTGLKRGAALAATLTGVAAVVMPSIFEETAGLAAIEQMMRGRLVIAAERGALPEVLGGAGLLFPPGDADALAACMCRAALDPSLVVALGRAARERALARFSQARMVEEHLRLYERVSRVR